MSKNRFFKTITWFLAAIMVFSVISIAAMAAEQNPSPSKGHTALTMTYEDQTASVTPVIRNGDTVIDFDATSKPSDPYTLSLTVASGKSDPVLYLGENIRPNGIEFPFETEGCTVEYDEEKNCLIFTFPRNIETGGTSSISSVDINIPCIPTVAATPEYEELINEEKSYIIAANVDDAIMIAEATQQKKGRKVLKSISGSTFNSKGSLRINDDSYTEDTLSYWTFEHISGEWYTISSGGMYLNFVGTNGAELSNTPVPFLIEKTGTNQIIISDGNGKYLTSQGRNPANGFACYTSKDNQQMNLYTAGDITNQSTKNLNGKSYVIVNETTQRLINSELGASEYNLVGKDSNIKSKTGDTTVWTFTNAGGDWYKISTGKDDGIKYLGFEGNKLGVFSNEHKVYVRHFENSDEIALSDSPYSNTSVGIKNMGTPNIVKMTETTASSQAVDIELVNSNKDSHDIYKAQKYSGDSRMKLLSPAEGVLNPYLIFANKDGSEIELEGYSGEHSAGESITLPTLAADSNGKEFLGWCAEPDFYSTTLGENGTTRHQFAESPYTMPENTVKLYPVWNTTNLKAKFVIRKDGEIQEEPKSHPEAESTAIGTYNNIVKKGYWIIDTDNKPGTPVDQDGGYLLNGLVNNLNTVPTEAQIKTALEKDGRTYDPETQYVHWYVLKYTGKEWHVDGVIRDREEVTVEIKGSTDTLIYDGEPHNVEDFTVELPKNVENLTLKEEDITRDVNAPEAKASGTDASATPYTMGLRADQFSNTNRRYNVTFKVTDGSLTINKRPIVFKGKDAEKTYTGSDITIDELDISGIKNDEGEVIGGLLAGSSHNVEFKATGKEASSTPYSGTITAKNDVVIKDKNENIVTANYDVTTNPGELTITQTNVPLTIELSGKEYVYDAKSHSLPEMATSNGAQDTTTIEYSQVIEGKDPVWVDDLSKLTAKNVADSMEIKAHAINPNYKNIPETTVSLTIKQKNLTITAIDQTKTYNAAAQGENNATYTTGITDKVTPVGLEGNDVLTSITLNGQETNAGEYTGKILPSAAAIGDATDNYRITYAAGKLTINPKAVTITVNGSNDSKVYNGSAQTSETTVIPSSNDSLFDASKFSYTGATTITEMNADSYSEAIDTTKAAYADDNLNVTFVAGTDITFEITKKPVTITVNGSGDSKVYNGNAQTSVTTITPSSEDELFDASKFSYTGATTITKTTVGNYNEAIDIAKAAYGDDNLDVNFAAGTDVTFEVTKKHVTITADDKTMIYGNDEPALTATTVGLEGSDYIATTQTREAGKDIGTYQITVNPIANPNYEIETVPGTLTIQPRPVTVTAADKAKTYSTADPAMTATVTGMATGESTSLIKYELSRANGEEVGTYAINPMGDAAQGNYTVTYVPATLTILPEDAIIVTITANNGEYEYDGTQKDLSGYSVSINSDLYKEADFTFNGSNTLKGVNAGTYRTNMKASDFVNTNTNFENVLFVVENGTLEITKRDVTLTSGNAEKTFDGTPLTNEEITVSGDGFAAGEGVNVTVTGRQTTEGESNNTFTYTMAANTQAGNYDITSEYGKLKVTENNGDELVEYHKLTITYQYEDGKVIKTFARDYMAGTKYYVASDKIAHYKADTAAVSGTMGNADINVTVTYTKATHTLTVKFVSMTDSSQVATPVIMELPSGDNYTVFVPAVEGYTAMTDKVTGIMPDSSRSVTVFFLPEGVEADITGIGGGAHAPIEIDDFGTPLGIADSILGGGEVIE